MNFWHRVRTAFAGTPEIGSGISLLVPFRSDNGRRQETWDWLRRYWAHELPGAEIVVGTNDGTPFCKTAAVNDAARRAHGDIFVILDADCYISGEVIRDCADSIRADRQAGYPLWYMPYRNLYRLTDAASRLILSSDPARPARFFAASPPGMMVENRLGSANGHWYGALIQIMPREAFLAAGGMDEHFRGWGGEDVAFMHAVDTLYGKHKTTANGVIHLWHPSIGTSIKDRMWDGQAAAGINGSLAARYNAANGDKARMQALVDEGRGNHD